LTLPGLNKTRPINLAAKPRNFQHPYIIFEDGDLKLLHKGKFSLNVEAIYSSVTSASPTRTHGAIYLTAMKISNFTPVTWKRFVHKKALLISSLTLHRVFDKFSLPFGFMHKSSYPSNMANVLNLNFMRVIVNTSVPTS
jgi:hypothetical protein